MLRRTLLGAALSALLGVGCTPADTTDDGNGGSRSTTTGAGQGGSAGVPEPPTAPAEPFALVELFTSEGCNSCPPAEQNFRTLLGNFAGQRVYALAWHVDYWDYLGWPDKYGSKDYANRQRNYATAYVQDTIFTPDMRVNTVNQQPPNVTTVSGAINTALTVQVPTSVTLWHEPNREQPVINFRLENAPPDAIFHLAIVESGMETTPTAGENNGVTLRHANVVRVHYAIEPVERGQLAPYIPDDLVRENALLITWLQSEDMLTLFGANALPLLPPE